MIPNDESKDMIKEVLQKIIDEMEGLETDRIMPEYRKPKAVAVEVEATSKPEEMDEMMEEDEAGLDPAVLDELMSKADEADETGALPEDDVSDLPPEINDAVRRKRKNDLPKA